MTSLAHRSGVPRSAGRRAAEFERAANALERSAELADALAVHERSTGHPEAAEYAFEAAVKARSAAQRARTLASGVRDGEDP